MQKTEIRLKTASETAEILNMPIDSLWRGCREGIIPHYRLGRLYRFDISKVLSALLVTKQQDDY